MKHLEHLMQNLSKMDNLCDLMLVAELDGEKFPVHRNVMVASSPFFETLLKPNHMEVDQNEIILTDITGTILKTIIDFCYSGCANISIDNADDIMVIASSMHLIYLEQICSNFWCEKLNVFNCVDRLMFASNYNFIDLWHTSLFFICDHFTEISIATFVHLDYENFDGILKEDEITGAESNIFDCFVEWIQYDETNRSQFVATIANSIRLEHIPTEFLSQVVEPFYQKYNCVKFVMDEYTKRSPDTEPISLHRMKNMYLAEITDPREIDTIYVFDANRLEYKRAIFNNWQNSFLSDGKLFGFDDVDDAEVSRNLKVCDLITSKEEMLPKTPFNNIFGPPIYIGNCIYMFGECNTANDTNFARFDTKQKLWQSLEPLPYRMQQLSVIELNGLIYVAGDIDRSENYSSNFWCYDPNRNVWSERAHTNLDGHRIVLCKAKQSIFICNHYVGLLKYDAILNRWTKLDIVLPEMATGDYEMYGAVDYGIGTFGIMSTEWGKVLVHFDSFEKECHLCDVHEHFSLEYDSEKNFHLFIH